MIKIIGTGKHMPSSVVSNEDIYRITERKNPEWISQSLGIEERRFFATVNEETGMPEERVDETRIAAKAAQNALKESGLAPSDIDRLIFVSCTQGQSRSLHFSLESMKIHEHLGFRPDTTVKEMDAGCGGFVYAMNEAIISLKGSGEKNALVVAANVTSNHFQPDYSDTDEAWLSTYIFGDGAGAMVIQDSENDEGSIILETYSEVDPEDPLMLFRQLDGFGDKQFYEVQRSVSGTYIPYMKRAIKGIADRKDKTISELIDMVDVLFAHQANGKLLDGLIRKLNIDTAETRVPRNVDYYGNIATATIPVLVDEADLSQGDLCLYAVVGAGAQIASSLVRV